MCYKKSVNYVVVVMEVLSKLADIVLTIYWLAFRYQRSYDISTVQKILNHLKSLLFPFEILPEHDKKKVKMMRTVLSIPGCIY